MTQPIILNGALKDSTTVILDEPLPVASGRVEVALRLKPDLPPPKQSMSDFLRDLRVRQSARGHTPMTADEIESYIRAERASWGD
jgi:hypothetical protein